MDLRISKIIEICGFEKDHLWKQGLNELFNGITIDNYADILKNRDNVIKGLLKKAAKTTDVQKFDKKISIDQLIKDSSVKIVNECELVTQKPILLSGGFHYPELGISIGAYPVFLGKNVSLTQTSIYAPTYLFNGVVVEHSSFQSKKRYNLIGPNARISNVGEIRGCFISGGLIRSKGRERTYIHADSINNVIAGNYSGISDGTDVYNHPVEGNSKLVDILSGAIFQTNSRKLPILIGIEATVGAQCLLNSGSIIGAGCVVPNRTEVDGAYYFDRKGEQKYTKSR